jgi:carboxypeptidase C (cathepsin A)
MAAITRCLAGVVALTALACGPALAQHPSSPAGSTSAAATPAKPADATPRLPADVATHHDLVLPGRTLHFTATAGSITLSDANGTAQAQIGFVAYTLDDAPPERRPVSFVMNGGPGSGSAWLQLGLLGPWRLPMNPEAAIPSAAPVPVDNADTWLDFTDLVFIDPIGTGYSKMLVNNDENRKKYWSVNGDVASLGEAIRHWLATGKRMTSPKFLIGESYSGLRVPRLARELTKTQGVGISGMTLISPKLDYGGRSNANPTLEWLVELPSEVATVRAKKGPVTRADMADVEAYAIGDYATDLLRGEDPAAVARRVEHITALTGLDPALVQRRHGKIGAGEFLRELNRDKTEIGSIYDATVTKQDPFPQSAWSDVPDPMTDALSAPVTSTIEDIYARRLNWLPDAPYELGNDAVNRAWDFGNTYYKPESTSALRQALAEDPNLHVLIGQGLFDLITPYFDQQLMLNQIPASVGRDRINFQVYPGGHMFYSRDASRAAFREAAQKLYAAP